MDPTDIKMIMKSCIFLCQYIENLNELDQFLEKYSFQKMISKT